MDENLYAGGRIGDFPSGISAENLAVYSPINKTWGGGTAWQPVAQQSVHWTAYAVGGLAFIANFVLGWFVFRGIIRRQ